MGKTGVGEILEKYLGEYEKVRKLSAHQKKALEAIRACRTHENGYHLMKCEECGEEEWQYNSCRDRNCPQCQWMKQQEWVEKRMAELPKIPYHHVVVTLPDILHKLMLMNQAVLYQIFFEVVSAALKEFGENPKHLGARIGMICVLHTWGQTLNYHVHMHCLVTGGGITKSGEWVEGKYGEEFLFPIRAVSQVIKGKLMDKLRKAYRKGELELEGKLKWMRNPAKFEYYLGGVAKEMVRVYSKPATKKPENVVKYLGAYMKRGPISNRRIKGMEDGKVIFGYKDYRNGGERKVMKMGWEEFIRRYVCHIVPKGFVKVRYYGVFAGRKKKEELGRLREIAGELEMEEEELEVVKCKVCKRGRMKYERELRYEEVEEMMMAMKQPQVMDTS